MDFARVGAILKRSKNRWNPHGLTPEGQTALADVRATHSQRVVELGALYEERQKELLAQYAQARQKLNDAAETVAAEIREQHAA